MIIFIYFKNYLHGVVVVDDDNVEIVLGIVLIGNVPCVDDVSGETGKFDVFMA